jgi:hypothetical protein
MPWARYGTKIPRAWSVPAIRLVTRQDRLGPTLAKMPGVPFTRFLDALRRDPAFGRSVLLWTIGISVAVITLVTVVLTVLALSSSASTADKLAAAGDVLVGATLLLAGIAAVVALLAYAVSTGSPDLRISVEFGGYSPNNPGFRGDILNNGVLETELAPVQFGQVFLHNGSGYSAKNPAVIVRLHGMYFAPDDRSFFQDWASMEIAYVPDILTPGCDFLTAVQWDGGPTYSIHGRSTRRLPDLQFSHLWHRPERGKPSLTFEILADGYRKEITLPVDFIVKGKSLYPREDSEANPGWM